MISTAAQTELDFLRPHLEGQAGYSHEDIAALISSCEQAAASSFIQHLVSLGLLSGSAARTLSAVQKGYATVPVASLLVGLRRPGAGSAVPTAPASASMALRPSLSASLQALVAPGGPGLPRSEAPVSAVGGEARPDAPRPLDAERSAGVDALAAARPLSVDAPQASTSASPAGLRFTEPAAAAGPERFAALQAQLRAFDAGASAGAALPPSVRPVERPALQSTAARGEAAARAAFGSGALPAGSLSNASVALRSRARETALRALDSALSGSGPPRDTLVSPPRPALPEPEYGTAVPTELVQRANARAASDKSSSSGFSLEELASSRLKARVPSQSSAPAPAPAATPRIPRPGEQLGRYRLQEALGDGSTAMTFRAYHDALAIPVAIKVYRPTERVADGEARARFISEARILAQLEHANIVRVIDVEDQGELPFIVFEYVGAMTLEEVVRASGRLSEERCLRIGHQVSEALNVANARGLLHRDVKPANVLVRKDGSVKLADFGLARELATGPSDLVCGTPAFMAPEAALTPGATDWRADMYGLGATLYFALTGRPPFERATPLDTVRAHIQEPVPPPSSIVAGLDLRVEFAVMKMLEKNPQARFASWTEVLLTFSELERTLAAPTPRRPATPSTSAGGVSQLMKSLTDLFRKPRA